MGETIISRCFSYSKDILTADIDITSPTLENYLLIKFSFSECKLACARLEVTDSKNLGCYNCMSRQNGSDMVIQSLLRLLNGIFSDLRVTMMVYHPSE